jgi:hypothetical protein
MKIRRRQFLRIAATASLTACSSESDDSTPASGDTGPGTDGTSDTTLDSGADAGTDGAVGIDAAADTDGGATDGSAADADAGDEDVVAPESVMSGPFWMHLAGDTALVRFVLKGEVGASVRFGEGEGEFAQLRSVTDEVEFFWPPPVFEAVHPDIAGTYTLHEATIPLAGATAPIPFVIIEDSGAETEGACPLPPSADRPFKIVWVADTMTGQFEEIAQMIAAENADLVVHGGDIQYQSNPLDTWLGFFENFRDVLQTTYTHFIIGNHEYDDYPSGVDEFDSQYRRFFDQQTGPDTGVHYHELRVGPLSWLLLNSEAEFDDAQSPQLQWAAERLQAANDDANIKQIVVGFHRPYYTFGSSTPRQSARAAVHPLLRDAGVKLVFNGHEHSYQRFTVDGVTYAVDGGGGALSYNTDERIEEIRAENPDEIELRDVAERSYGICILDVAVDGTIAVKRLAVDSSETDSFTVSPA